MMTTNTNTTNQPTSAAPVCAICGSAEHTTARCAISDPRAFDRVLAEQAATGVLSGLGDPALDSLEEVISKLEAMTPEQVEAAELRLKLMQAERPAPISSAADQQLVLLVALLALTVGSVALALALLNSCRR